MLLQSEMKPLSFIRESRGRRLGWVIPIYEHTQVEYGCLWNFGSRAIQRRRTEFSQIHRIKKKLKSLKMTNPYQSEREAVRREII